MSKARVAAPTIASQPVRCIVIATTFGGSTSAASYAVTLPPTIAGPAGTPAPLAFALAATKFTTKENKNLKLAFVSTAARDSAIVKVR